MPAPYDPRHFHFVRNTSLPRSAFENKSDKLGDLAVYALCAVLLALFVVLFSLGVVQW